MKNNEEEESSDSRPGVRVPLRVRKHFPGGAKNFRSYQNKPTIGQKRGFGGTQRESIWIWGYTKVFSIDLGVHK